MWDSPPAPYEIIIPLPACPVIYVVKGGGGGGVSEEGKSACRSTGELARCGEDHKDFGRRVAVMWWPSDTHGHHSGREWQQWSTAHRKAPAFLICHTHTHTKSSGSKFSPPQSCWFKAALATLCLEDWVRFTLIGRNLHVVNADVGKTRRFTESRNHGVITDVKGAVKPSYDVLIFLFYYCLTA